MWRIGLAPLGVILTLAANSNSSPTLPEPIHVLVPRHSFLHVSLQDAVQRLHQFAPPTFGGWGATVLREEEPKAGSLFREEEDSDEDKDAKKNGNPTDDTTSHQVTTTPKENLSYPVCWFEDEATQTALRWHLFAGVLYDLKEQPEIPWRIRLHFTAYPTSQILPLENDTAVLHQVRSIFKNSLKQAMCLHYGNSKPALNLTKENHGKIWQAVETSNYHLYKHGHSNLPKQSSTRIPVRVFVNAGPPIQKPCLGTDALTLGAVLHEATPHHFDEHGVAQDSVVDWRVAGLSKPPLDVSVQYYWINLAHPDHFLYILVLTR